MNVDVTNLEITGSGDQPVPNRFLRQHDETTTLAVLLPGLGYTADMPLFQYAERIALERGWDVLQVRYDDRGATDDSEFAARFAADVDDALAAGLEQWGYPRVVMVGKSLGTLAMAHLLAGGAHMEWWPVWLTPLLGQAQVRAAIEAHPGRTFVAIGTADDHVEAEHIDDLRRADGVDVVVVDGADHSMDISDDLPGSVAAMGRLMSRLDAFLPEKHVTP